MVRRSAKRSPDLRKLVFADGHRAEGVGVFRIYHFGLRGMR